MDLSWGEAGYYLTDWEYETLTGNTWKRDEYPQCGIPPLDPEIPTQEVPATQNPEATQPIRPADPRPEVPEEEPSPQPSPSPEPTTPAQPEPSPDPSPTPPEEESTPPTEPSDEPEGEPEDEGISSEDQIVA